MLSVAKLSVMVVTILELLGQVSVAVTDRFWSKCENINRPRLFFSVLASSSVFETYAQLVVLLIQAHQD